MQLNQRLQGDFKAMFRKITFFAGAVLLLVGSVLGILHGQLPIGTSAPAVVIWVCAAGFVVMAVRSSSKDDAFGYVICLTLAATLVTFSIFLLMLKEPGLARIGWLIVATCGLSAMFYAMSLHRRTIP